MLKETIVDEITSLSAAGSGPCIFHPRLAQQAPAPENAPFEAGQPLGVMVEDSLTPMSENVKVYGAIVNAESCAYDEGRDLILAINRGVNQDQVANDGFVSLINHDGSVHTSRWIGVNRNGLVLNQPFGSDIEGGKLYVADRDGGTAEERSQRLGAAHVRYGNRRSRRARSGSRTPPASTISKWPMTAPFMRRRPARTIRPIPPPSASSR